MNTMSTTTTTTKPRAVRKTLTPEQIKARAEKAAATKAANAYSFTSLAVATIVGFLSRGSTFYARALTYHRQQGTMFPRPRNAGEIARLTALKEDVARKEVNEIIRQHNGGVLAPGNKTAQSMFDLYMVSIRK